MAKVPHEHTMLLRPTSDIVTERVSLALRREDEERTLPGCEGMVPAELEEQLLRLHVPYLCPVQVNERQDAPHVPQPNVMVVLPFSRIMPTYQATSDKIDVTRLRVMREFKV